MYNRIPTVLAALAIGGSLSAQQVFVNQIAGSGLSSYRGHVRALYDHDKDGYTDVIYSEGNPHVIRLMRNNGNLTFTDISASSGFQYVAGDIQVMDVDNNGWVDVICVDWATNTIRVMLNTNGQYTVTTTVVPIDIDGAAYFLDHDGNGSQDLAFVTTTPNSARSIQVIYNDLCPANTGTPFQTYAALVGPFAAGLNPIPYVMDIDNDVDGDLLVVLDGSNSGSPGAGYHYQPVKAYRNDAGTYTDVTATTGLGLGHGTGCSIWDYNKDGFQDLTFGSYDCCDNPNVTRTYMNNGNGTFTDVSASVVLKSGNHYYYYAAIGDVENDGDDDVYWWQGAWGTSHFFRNDGGVFSGNVAASYGLNLTGGNDWGGNANGIEPHWFDADNDGDLDVLCGTTWGTNEQAKLMVNPLNPSPASGAKYLVIDLEGCTSGRTPFNSVVKVYAGGAISAQLCQPARYGGKLQTRLHFGLGNQATADSVVVRWSSGASTTVYNVAASQTLLIREDVNCQFQDCLGGVDCAALVGTPCEDGDPTTGNDVYGPNCECIGTIPCAQNEVTLTLSTDANGGQTAWEIVPAGGGAPVCSGAGYPDNTSTLLDCCLPTGCYTLRVSDSFGDGMASGPIGGYVLRDVNGQRIIDNAGDGVFAYNSQAPETFCVPLGSDALTFASCDQEAVSGSFTLQVVPNTAVTAQYGVTNSTSGYQFWIFNPDGGYSRRVTWTHAAPGTSAPAGTDPALRASYLRLNALTTNPVPAYVLLNVRVRARIAGVFAAFGPACRLKIDPTANCKLTRLTNTADPVISCGATDLVADGTDTLYAVLFPGANKYQFRFTRPGYTRNIATPTRVLVLNPWITDPLQPGLCYDVVVRSSFDNGNTWCAFGISCNVCMAVPPPSTGSERALEEQGGAVLTLWPNPNRGDALNVRIEELPAPVATATIELHDALGRKVLARIIPVNGTTVNTVLELGGQVPTGIYLVTVTAGEQNFLERVVIE